MAAERPVVRRITLKPEHQPKGNVHYFVEGKPMPRPRMLEIVKLPAADACHIVYVDDQDHELNESWHPTIEAAIYHAQWEYGIRPGEWTNLQVGGEPV